MKKILFFLLTILMSAFTFAQTFTSNGINYNITDATNKKVEVSTHTSFTGAANIPQTVTYNGQNYTVTKIGDYAFLYCNGLTSVSLPNTITSIGIGAFSDCTQLISITIPNSVTSIGGVAFYGCTNLMSITLSNSLNSLGDSAFYYCTQLNSIVIPNSVTSIGYGIFVGCSGLTSITLPSSITSIGQDVFYNCTSLNTINCNITTPIIINANVFTNVNKNTCVLKVPTASLTAYKNAPVWKDFLYISSVLATNSFNKENKDVQIYPNPAKDYINIKSENILKSAEIYDQQGKKLKSATAKQINVTDLKPGVYLIKTQDKNNQSSTQKFIKQ